MEEIFNKNVKSIMKGLLISIIITFIALFIFSIFLTYTSLSEVTITPVIIIINFVALLIGSSIGTIKMNNKGIFKGAIIGLIYIGFIYLMSSIINLKFELTQNSIIIIASSVIAGGIGGIIGVNMKK